jgi:hypothetical protein
MDNPLLRGTFCDFYSLMDCLVGCLLGGALVAICNSHDNSNDNSMAKTFTDQHGEDFHPTCQLLLQLLSLQVMPSLLLSVNVNI